MLYASVESPLVVVGAVLAGPDGCVFRTLPIPPPGVVASAITCAPDLGCPSDGVIVTLRGLAQPGAIVIAENISRGFADGRRYSSQAFAVSAAAADAGTLAAPGTYEVVLGPMPDPPGPAMLSHHGDHIVVFQLVRNTEGLFESSDAATVTVP